MAGEENDHECEDASVTSATFQSLDMLRIGKLLRESAEPFSDIEQDGIGPLLERIGDKRTVLIGEASRGTSEFYRMRARITRELIEHKGFNIVAIEGDWPDAARINRYVRHLPNPAGQERAFTRFPTWMWRNHEVADFVEWLREWNGRRHQSGAGVGFFGLDLYSLYTSINEVVAYLETVDPEAASAARERYGCFSPWQREPSEYGRAALLDPSRLCRDQAVEMLRDLLARRLEYAARDGERFWDALHNARLIADAEGYYRIMYRGSAESWNFRDQHMFETLKALHAWHGPEAKAVVWAHNSHLGDASATEMSARGEINLGYLCRSNLKGGTHLIGFGTDHGTVAAASDWGGPMQVMNVRPARHDSYEGLFHSTGIPAFRLALTQPRRIEVAEELQEPKLERAIGVIYRPDTERMSHYFHAVLPLQFDDYIWMDETRSVEPFGIGQTGGLPETYPFGL